MPAGPSAQLLIEWAARPCSRPSPTLCGQSCPKASENQGVTLHGRTRVTGWPQAACDICGRLRLTPTGRARENRVNPNEVNLIPAELEHGPATIAAQRSRPTPDAPSIESHVEVLKDQRLRRIATT